MLTIELADGGILLYEESFLPSELAQKYFQFSTTGSPQNLASARRIDSKELLSVFQTMLSRELSGL